MTQKIVMWCFTDLSIMKTLSKNGTRGLSHNLFVFRKPQILHRKLLSTTMKSPSQTQNTNNIHPITLSNSLLQSLSSNAESPVLPRTMTNTSPESEALQRRLRLRMILESAISLLDFDDFNTHDFSPTVSTTHQRPL